MPGGSGGEKSVQTVGIFKGIASIPPRPTNVPGARDSSTAHADSLRSPAWFDSNGRACLPCPALFRMLPSS
jgi:hypothetical protein